MFFRKPSAGLAFPCHGQGSSASVGAILGLLLANQTLNVSSTIGLIALFGICAQNDIVLIAKINDLRRKGLWLREAIIEGALSKFRSIFITDMVMIVGVLPLALTVTTGAELHRPLALVCIGGFAGAIFLRLFLVPVLYETLARIFESSRRSPPVALIGPFGIFPYPTDETGTQSRCVAAAPFEYGCLPPQKKHLTRMILEHSVYIVHIH